MKYLILFAVITILSTFVFLQSVDAQDIVLDSYKNSDLVLVGKVINLSQTPSTQTVQQSNQTQYDIQVEKYYKNPQSAKLVSAYGYGKGIYFMYDPTFDVGDRLYLFLKKEQGRYVIQHPSFRLDNDCSADGLVPSNVFEDPNTIHHGPPANTELSVSGFDENGKFQVADTVQINYSAENYFPLMTNAIVELNVTDQDGKVVLYDKKEIVIPACNGQVPLLWNLVAEKIGNYSAQVKVFRNYEISRETFFSREEPRLEYGYVVEANSIAVSLDKTVYPILAPLKQFKSGIAAKDVVCKQGRVYYELVMKKSNGQPICIKGTSLKALTLRGYIPEYNGALDGEIPTDDPHNEKEVTTENTMIINDKTYFFSTINQTKPWALEGKKISFHDVTFTLFPRPSSLNLGGFCGSGTFGASIRFPDGLRESLSIRIPEMECLHDFAKTDLTKLTNHTNPQAGLTVSDQELRVLVSADNQPLFYPQKEYVDSIPLDFSNASNENPLGIEARVVIEPDTAIMCPIENCKIPPTPHLVLTSQKSSQFVGYEVCDGLSCKKDRLHDDLYVWLNNIPENYSGTNSIMISHINLGDFPWKKDDIVNIKVIAFPATLLENNVVVRHTDQIMTVDLGKSRIE